MTTPWPVAQLDPIQRAKVLAAALPGAGWAEGVVDAPYEKTWSYVTDFQRTTTQFDSGVFHMRVLERTPLDDHELVRLRANVLPFNVRVEDGFCLMQGWGRLYVVLMAAVPEGPDRTRFFIAEAVPRRGGRLLRAITRRETASDVRNLTRLIPRSLSD